MGIWKHRCLRKTSAKFHLTCVKGKMKYSKLYCLWGNWYISVKNRDRIQDNILLGETKLP